MTGRWRVFTVVVLLCCVAATPALAINVDIIESQSFNTTHTMDQRWFGVSTNLGHNATIRPQTDLDNPTFLPVCDLLIISSGVISLTPQRKLTVLAAMAQGIPVYVQTENDPTLDPSGLWLDLVADQFATFAWGNSYTAPLSPMRITGTASSTPNTTQNIPGFNGGASGTGSQEIETILHHAAEEFGWYLRPQAGQIVMAATTTDQDWIINGGNIPLMENLVLNLISSNATHLQIRCWLPGPPVVIPAAGGSFSAQTQAYNTGPAAITFDAWTRVTLPNGNFTGPFVNFTNLTIASSTTSIVYTFNTFVPGFAPSGTYYLHTGVGTYGGYEFNIDAIEFTKQ
ncbi:hypothetical protein KQI52_03900 [bacterium]|nr:hypothetical protein [bacterium]